ncbi:MAG: hypothetical protein PF689_13585 [Deltaproteobacteria bacterium]|jgi:hypothetical protein|nr:hypothetical protein [Deltaproteobacteria bacterium]
MNNKLFGTEEFKDLATSSSDQNLPGTPEISSNNKDDKITRPYGDDPFEKQENNDSERNIFKFTFSKPMILVSIFVFIGICVLIALVSVHVNSRKKIISYQLSAQTRLMQRLSKKKAMFELEYSYLKSKQSIDAKLKESNWEEVAPEQIKYIKIQSSYNN